MNPSIPTQMKAAVIDKFGGPEELHTATLPVPECGTREILIEVDTAGIGAWDPWLRSGGFGDGQAGFPRVLGNDGAGTVVAIGSGVKRFQVGDRVYAFGMGGKRGGFYAEYAAVPAKDAALIPPNLSVEEAGVLATDGITALLGLEALELKKGAALLIFGASGGVGHLALQLAHRMGARVLGVASGEDGVELVGRLGAEEALEGHTADLPTAARRFAPDGLDGALVLAGGPVLDDTLKLLRRGARVAYPHGVEPEPRPIRGVRRIAYDAEPSVRTFERLNRWIASGEFNVEVSRTYALEDAPKAHEAVLRHHLGKLAFRVHA